MIERLIKFTTLIFFLLFPLYFLPLGNTSVDYDKQIILLVFSLLLFILTVIKTLNGKKITLVQTPFDILLILLTLLYLFSSLIVSPNKIESLLAPMGGASMFALTLLYFSLTHSARPGLAGSQGQALPALPITALLISAILLSIPILVRQFNPNLNIFPLGSYYSTALFLVPLVVYSVVAFIRPRLSIPKGVAFMAFVAFLILISALALSVYHLFTDLPAGQAGQKPILLPPTAGWAILLESYKNVSHFALGVGPNNFSSAYALGKPLLLNTTPFWNAISFMSSSFLFTAATEVGILGFLLLSIMFIKIIKFIKISKYNLLPLTISFLILLLLPIQLPHLILTIILLAASSPQKIKQFTLPIAKKFTVYLTLILLITSALLLYWPFKSYASDVLLRLSRVSNSNQFLGTALNFSQKAIEFNPYSERAYSLSSSLTLEALRNIAGQANASDSAEITQSLAGQAITHARKTTELSPQKSENWGLLGDTYQSLSGIAENANTWALNAYNQQMLLNPFSPQVKVSAGGLSMISGDHETAVLLFRQAINLKPDWNNAHYNLAILYSKTGNYNYAMVELQKTLSYTPADSPDYAQVSRDLQSLQQLLNQPASPSGEATSSAKSK